MEQAIVSSSTVRGALQLEAAGLLCLQGVSTVPALGSCCLLTSAPSKLTKTNTSIVTRPLVSMVSTMATRHCRLALGAVWASVQQRHRPNEDNSSGSEGSILGPPGRFCSALDCLGARVGVELSSFAIPRVCSYQDWLIRLQKQGRSRQSHPLKHDKRYTSIGRPLDTCSRPTGQSEQHDSK